MHWSLKVGGSGLIQHLKDCQLQIDPGKTFLFLRAKLLP